MSSLKTAIPVDQPAITRFCEKWRIKELALFGSVLTDEFRPDSDIDFLVSFDDPQPDWGPWMGRWQDMHEELELIVGRKVDLVEKRSVERSKNYIKRRHILEHQQTIYVAR
jgi:predicted nucleotidyltransferase